MKRIYLDWGVVSNLKKPEFAEEREFLLSHKRDLFFVYSSAHFEDAMRSEGDERLHKDIQTLESLVDNHLLLYDKKTAYPYLATPSDYYRDHKGQNLDIIPCFSELVDSICKDIPLVGRLLQSYLDVPFPILDAVRSQELWEMMLPDLPDFPTFKDVINSAIVFVNQMQGEKEFYKTYRSAVRTSGFSLEPNAGNWKANEVIPNISARIKALGIDKTFKELVFMGFGNKEKVDFFRLFVASYSMLDLIGYKSDKLPKSSNAMNSVSTDAQHAFFAAFCDYLITQDTHLASKARALYHEFDISTKVITLADVIIELKDERKEDIVSFLSEQLIEERVVHRDENTLIYRFSHRFLSCFTHCVRYEQDDYTLLEFKLDYENYSRVLFFDEAGIMVDTVSDYLGRPPQKEYVAVRERIIHGDLGASLNWPGDDIFFTLRADPKRLRPELFVKITVLKNA